jgi:hypothetical protein
VEKADVDELSHRLSLLKLPNDTLRSIAELMDTTSLAHVRTAARDASGMFDDPAERVDVRYVTPRPPGEDGKHRPIFTSPRFIAANAGCMEFIPSLCNMSGSRDMTVTLNPRTFMRHRRAGIQEPPPGSPFEIKSLILRDPYISEAETRLVFSMFHPEELNVKNVSDIGPLLRLPEAIRRLKAFKCVDEKGIATRELVEQIAWVIDHSPRLEDLCVDAAFVGDEPDQTWSRLASAINAAATGPRRLKSLTLHIGHFMPDRILAIGGVRVSSLSVVTTHEVPDAVSAVVAAQVLALTIADLKEFSIYSMIPSDEGVDMVTVSVDLSSLPNVEALRLDGALSFHREVRPFSLQKLKRLVFRSDPEGQINKYAMHQILQGAQNLEILDCDCWSSFGAQGRAGEERKEDREQWNLSTLIPHVRWMTVDDVFGGGAPKLTHLCLPYDFEKWNDPSVDIEKLKLFVGSCPLLNYVCLFERLYRHAFFGERGPYAHIDHRVELTIKGRKVTFVSAGSQHDIMTTKPLPP